MAKSRIYFGIWSFLVLCLYLCYEAAAGSFLVMVTIFLLIWCLVSALLMRNQMEGSFQIPVMTEKGKPAKGVLQVKNHGFLPAGSVCVHLEFHNRLTGERKRRRLICSVGAKGEETMEFSMESQLCGSVQVRIKHMMAYDFLGLFGSVQKADSKGAVLVLPDLFPVEPEISDGTSLNWESVRYSDLKKGDDPSEIFGIREYQEGDSPKNIHWKLSQKFDSFFVKELSLPVEHAVLLFFETSEIEGSKKCPKQVAALMETFLSWSQALAEKGYVHALGWYDQKQERLCFEQVENEDDLAVMIHGLLSLERKERTFTGLQEYIQKYQETPFEQVVYFTVDEPDDACASLAEWCYLSVVHGTEKEEGESICSKSD